ncbi:TolC family protein [Compostibacter hankyongensis]|uniref:TolC family protein n=1 Tax=Compostibacter hankyongensis TaxID=1007089 RepID=A0ABP8FEC6_9BACT
MRIPLLLFAAVLFSVPGRAQETWSLTRCIQYAREHNIQIKQQVLQKRLADLTLKQSRLSQIPSLNGNVNYGFNFGRSVNPTTYEFDNTQFNSGNIGVNSSVTLFNFFQKRNTIAADKYAAQAADATVQKLFNDVSLNIATAYLQMLQAREQVKVSEEQVSLTQHQLENTTKQVEAGSLPESNRADLIAQLARDSSDLITNQNSATMAVLQMKALLNLDFETEFEPEIPENIDDIPLLNLLATGPRQIYEGALAVQPQLKADSFQILSSEKRVDAAKSALYPSIALSGGIGSNYASATRTITGEKVPFGKQLDNNFNENIGIGLNIPIFNGWQARAGVRQAQIDLENQRLTKEQDQLQLKQDIYQAYADAGAALEKYHAAQKSLEASRTAFFYASKRYELGVVNSIDYLTSQNNLYKAQTDMLTSHYEYVFKMKVLEFYRDLNIHF